MSDRYCPKCATEVEDAGGYCLLGHRLSLVAPTASLRELRDEVDAAFEDARVTVTTALGPPAEPPLGQAPMAPPPPPPQDRRPHEPAPLGPATHETVPHEPTPHASAPHAAASPAGPSVWHELSQQRTASGPDPIVAFAPAPRMDWGPDRKSPLKRLRARPSEHNPAFQS